MDNGNELRTIFWVKQQQQHVVEVDKDNTINTIAKLCMSM